MKNMKINCGKIAFLMCNFIFLLSGICLELLGCLLVNDAPRILLSQLVVEPGIISQPLLYYAALAFIALGLIVCAVALLGCWASWTPDSNWLMGTYMFLLIILLLTETSFGAVVSLCPQIIGVILDRDLMVSGLMNNYGVPGRSQYTAAVDLAQTLFECCGMQSGSDYDGSKWWKREQDTMHDLRVPHSCCFLSNTDDENSFLDPKPVNSSLCQAKTNSRYQYGRHVKGCLDKLTAWFKDHITIFLIIGLALIVVQLAVLLCAILICLRKRKPSASSPSSIGGSLQQPSSSQLGNGERKVNLLNDSFRTERVPSYQSKFLPNSIHQEPWNIVGIPTQENFKSFERQDESQIVRNAVRDIELGLYNKEYQDCRKDIIEEKIDITQAKLYWQEKEKHLKDQILLANPATDYCTDFSVDKETDENVVVSSVKKSNEVILKPNAKIHLTQTIPKKRSLKRTKSLKNFSESEKENLHDFEKNWVPKNKYFWTDAIVSSVNNIKKGKMNDTADKVLKFQNICLNEMWKTSQIPRVRTERICRVCKRITERERCSVCQKLKTKSQNYFSFGNPVNLENKKYLSAYKSAHEEKEHSKNDFFWISFGSQRSRKNFFGNSGSYTLRCNLNPINPTTNKKFYLTPETLPLCYWKKLKKPRIVYKNFTAKKREFKKHKVDLYSQFDDLKANSDVVLW